MAVACLADTDCPRFALPQMLVVIRAAACALVPGWHEEHGRDSMGKRGGVCVGCASRDYARGACASKYQNGKTSFTRELFSCRPLTKADSSTVTALTTTVANEADSSTVTALTD